MTLPLARALQGLRWLADHVRISAQSRRVLAPLAPQRRLAARIIFEHLDERELLAFGLGDDHAHLLAALARLHAGRRIGALATALRKRLPVDGPFEPAHHKPVVEQRHLETALSYDLFQPRRHAPDLDPTFDGTSLPDLVGARILLVPVGRSHPDQQRFRVLGDATAARVARLLPRVRVEDLRERMLQGIVIVDDGRVRLADARTADPAAPTADVLCAQSGDDGWGLPPPLLTLLADAAAAAVGLPHLMVPGPVTLQARRAAVHLVRDRYSLAEIADALRTTPRTVQRAAAAVPAPRLVQAVELQLQLRGRRLPR